MRFLRKRFALVALACAAALMFYLNPATPIPTVALGKRGRSHARRNSSKGTTDQQLRPHDFKDEPEEVQIAPTSTQYSAIVTQIRVPRKDIVLHADNLRIAIGVLTAPKHVHRIAVMNASWVISARAMGMDVLFFSDKDADARSSDVVQCNCASGKEGLCCKNDCLMLTLAHRYPDADWYIRAMDDTWIIPQNLLLQLQSLDPSVPYLLGDMYSSPGNHHCIGLPLLEGVNNVPACYPAGGASAAVSAAGMRLYEANEEARIARVCPAGSIVDDVYFGHVFNSILGLTIVGDRGFTMLPAQTTSILSDCEVSDLELQPGCYSHLRPTPVICVLPYMYPAAIHVGNDDHFIDNVAPLHAALSSVPTDQLVLTLPPSMFGEWRWKVCRADYAMLQSVKWGHARLEGRSNFVINVIAFSGGLQLVSAHMEENQHTVDLFIVVEDKGHPAFVQFMKLPHIASFGKQLIYMTVEGDGKEGQSDWHAAAHERAQHELQARGVNPSTAIIIHTQSTDILDAGVVAIIGKQQISSATEVQLSVRDVTLARVLQCDGVDRTESALVLPAASAYTKDWRGGSNGHAIASGGWRCVLCGGPHVLPADDLNRVLTDNTPASDTGKSCTIEQSNVLPRIVVSQPWKYRWLLNPQAVIEPQVG
jgi:hypothetical protein